MLNFGTVGTSWITDEYIKGAKDSGLWKLSAVYSRSYEKAKDYALKHSADFFYTDIEEMAASDKFEAVYIASPNLLHYEQALCFLKQGKHVICEKPISGQAYKVREMVETAREKKLIFMEAIMFMHLPQLKKLESELLNIGNISLVKLDFCQRSSKLDIYNRGGLPNIFNPELETGSFMDLGIYCVYPALYFFGIPEKISGHSLMLNSRADGAGLLSLEYADKLISLSYSKLGRACAGSEFQGSTGSIYVDSISRLADMKRIDNQGNVTLIHGSDEKYKLMGYESISFYNFISNLKKHKNLYDNCCHMSVMVSEFMEAARKQLGIVFSNDSKI